MATVSFSQSFSRLLSFLPIQSHVFLVSPFQRKTVLSSHISMLLTLSSSLNGAWVGSSVEGMPVGLEVGQLDKDGAPVGARTSVLHELHDSGQAFRTTDPEL